MSVISDADYEIFSKQLGELGNRFGGIGDSLESLKKVTELAKNGIRDEAEITKQFNRVMKDRKEREQEILKSQREGKRTTEETRASLKLLNDEVRSAIPPGFEKNFDVYIQNQTKVTDSFILLNNVLTSTVTKSFTSVASSVGNFTLALTKSYQSASSGFEMGLTTGAAGIDALAGTASKVGKGISFVGDKMAQSGNVFVSGIGTIVSVLGGATSAVADQFKEIAGKVMPIVLDELRMYQNSLVTSSSAGALFSNGVTGMRLAAKDAGIDLGTFSKVVKENQGSLEIFGGSMQNGIKRLANVNQTLKSSGLEKQLLNLGYSVEEIPGMIATVGAKLTKAGGASDTQVAQATADYAKNLRLIAEITGEDAKARSDEVDRKNQDLAFQLKAAAMGQENAQLLENNMKQVAPPIADMVREMVVSGGNITSERLNMIAQQAPATAEMARQMYDMATNGKLVADSGAQLKAQFGDALQQQIKGTGDFATAASVMGGAEKEVAEGLLQIRNEGLIAAKHEELKISEDALNKQAATTDKVTDALGKFQEQGMATKIAMQDLAGTMIGSGKLLETMGFMNTATLGLMKSFDETASAFLGKTKTAEQKSKEEQENKKGAEKEADTSVVTKAATAVADTILMPVTGLIKLFGDREQSMTPVYDALVRGKGTEAVSGKVTQEEAAKNEANAGIGEKMIAATADVISVPITGLMRLFGDHEQSMTPVYDALIRGTEHKPDSEKTKDDESSGLISGPVKAFWNSIFGGSGSAGGNILSGSAEGFFSKLHGTETVIPLPAGMTGDSFKQLLEVAIGALSNKDKPAVTPSNSDTKISQDSLNSLTGSMTSSFTPLTTGINDFSSSVNTISSAMTNFAKSTVESIHGYIESANRAFDPLVKKDSDTASSFDAIKSQITRFVDIVPTLAPKVTPDENAVDPMTYGATQITDAISSMMVANNPTDSISALITQSKEQAATIQDQISKMITDSSGINSGDISTLVSNMSGSISGSIKELIASGSQATDASTAMLLQQMPELTDSFTNAVAPISDGMDSLMKSIMEQTGSLADFTKSSSVTGDMFSKFLDDTQTDPNTNNENTISSYIDSINHIFDPFVQKKVDDTVPQNPDTTISENISSFGSDLSSLSNTLIEQFSKLLENNTGTKESMDNLVTKVTPVEELMVREPRTDELLEILNRQVAELISLTSSVATHTETTSLRIM
jgi:hypothetical protein